MRLWIRVVGFCLVAGLVAGGCSASDTPSARASTSRVRRTVPTPSSAVTRSDHTADASPAERRTGLIRLRKLDVPVPDDVRRCLESKVADDAQALTDLGAGGRAGPVPDSVMNLAAVCMREQRALPAFVRALEAQLGRDLSAEQRECISAAYLAVPAEAMSAVEAEALGSSEDGASRTQIGDLVATCGVDLNAD